MKKFFLAVFAIMVCARLAFSQVEITGVVTPAPERHFQGSPAKDWPVTKIHVKVGDMVRAGDCLIELDPAVFPSQKAEAELESAKLSVKVIKARLEIQRKILDRCQNLAKVNAMSPQDHESQIEAVNVLNAELEKANANEKAAYAAMRMAKYDFDAYQRINSPIKGQVVAIRCSLGMVARAENQQLVWVEVIDSSRVQITCNATIEQAKVLRDMIGQDGINVEGCKSCHAKVMAVPRLIVNGKTAVILETENPNGELICGQQVRLTLPVEQKTK